MLRTGRVERGHRARSGKAVLVSVALLSATFAATIVTAPGATAAVRVSTRAHASRAAAPAAAPGGNPANPNCNPGAGTTFSGGTGAFHSDQFASDYVGAPFYGAQDVPNANFTNIFLYPGAGTTSWNDYQKALPADQQGPTVEQIDAMTTALVCSSYFDELTQYNINPPTYSGDENTILSCVNAALQDAQSNGGLLSWQGQGSFAGCENSNNGNTSGQVNIFISGDMKAANSPINGKDICSANAAYHSGGLGAPNFTLIPMNHSCNADAGAVMNSLSHEMVELVSDPALMGWVHTGDIFNPGQNYSEGELGDICQASGAFPTPSSSPGSMPFPSTPALTAAGLSSLTVAPYWSDQDNACEPTSIMTDTLVPIAGSPSIRFKGDVHDLPLTISQTNPPAGLLDSLELDVVTGGDNLNSGSAANVIVQARRNGQLVNRQTSVVNEGTEWANNSLHAVLLAFPPGISVGDITKITLNTQLSNDNWDVSGVMVQAGITSAVACQGGAGLLDVTGTQKFDDGNISLFRFKGGSSQTFTSTLDANPSALEQRVVTKLSLIVGTGGDDLSGGNSGNDNANAILNLTNGTSISFPNINRNANWPNDRQSRKISLLDLNTLPPNTSLGQLQSFAVQTNLPGGSNGDNWDMQLLQLDAQLGCPAATTPPVTDTETLVDAVGHTTLPDNSTGLCRLTGAVHDCQVSLQPPAGLDPSDLVDALQVTITTGDDDLRAGTFAGDNATVAVGTPTVPNAPWIFKTTFNNVNDFQPWNNNSINLVPLAPIPPTTLGQLTTIDVSTQFNGNQNDNWDIKEVKLDALLTLPSSPAPSGAPSAHLNGAGAADTSPRTTTMSLSPPEVAAAPAAPLVPTPSPWSIVPSGNLGASDNVLDGVTCVNTPKCIGVGFTRDHDGGPQVLMLTHARGKWQDMPAQAPNAARSVVTGVSCASATLCFAVGYDGSGGPEGPGGFAQSLIERWNGTSWSVTTSANLPGAAMSVLTGVSCLANGFCVAVGYQAPADGPAQTLIERFIDNVWIVMPSVNGASGNSVLNGVSCVSATHCVAVGSNDGGGIDQSLIETWDGTAWTATPTTNMGFPGNVFYNMGANILYGVSCSSVIDCKAVGTYIDHNRVPQALVEGLEHEGRDWAPALSVSPSSRGSLLFGVSCTITVACTAVGSWYDGSVNHTLNENWNGTDWFVTATPDPAGARNVLSGVSCTDPGACTAVGDDGEVSAPNQTLAMDFAPTPPNAATQVKGIGGDGEAIVSFLPSTDDGGSDITYTVAATDLTTPGNGGQTATGSASPITVPGLADGDKYTFTVTPITGFAAGPTSTPSPAITLRPPMATNFTSMTLQNGWTNAPFATSKVAAAAAFGIVYLKGAAATTGSNPVVFTLPGSLRPATAVYVPVDLCDSAKGRLSIQPSGVVTVQAENAFSDAQCFTSFDGVSYVLTAPTALTLRNGWTNAPAGTSNAAAASISGIVHLKGAIATTGTNAVPFVLPASLRPATAVYVPVDLCNAANGRLYIQPSGVVTVQAENSFADAQCITSLDGASYALAASTPLSLQHGWTNAALGTAGTAAAMTNGIVHLRGAIATAGTNAVAFNLPPQLRPATAVYVPVDLCNEANGRLYIQPNGVVTVQTQSPFSDAQCATSLDGAWYGSAAVFTSLSLQNGWTNAPFATSNAAAGSVFGTVYLKGAIATTGTNPAPFTLPSALRPATDVYVPVDLCGATKGRLYIQPSGVVTVEAESSFTSAQCFTSLDGASYSLVATTPLTLQNGWTGAPFATDNPAASFVSGIVSLHGAIATTGTNPVPFTLPASLRPATDLYVPVDLCGAANGRLYIQPTGLVTVQAETTFFTAQCFTSLDGASYALGATTPLTLQNGWTNAPFGSANAAATPVSGIVHLKGAIATTGTNPVAFTLPSILRPAKAVYVPVDLCNASNGRLYIQPTGVVTVVAETAFSNAQCFTSLDGASYAR